MKKPKARMPAATRLAKRSAKPVKRAAPRKKTVKIIAATKRVAVRKSVEDCSERVRFEQEHVVAFTEWINAGGEERSKAADPAVVAAAAKLSAALKAMTEHRKKHDC